MLLPLPSRIRPALPPAGQCRVEVLRRGAEMTFELEVDGLRLWCSSPLWTRRLVERGARLVDARQAEELRRALEVSGPGGDDGSTVEGKAPA
jgi:hypothetical protein